MKTVISVENLSKSYRLGQIGTGTLSRDLEIWLAKLRGKPNPYLKIGQTDPSELDGETLWALRDVSFQVQQGEVLGIIGRNGAGKSTLLKILSRVTAPTSGQVKVKGRIASLLEVGTGFHPELTGRENIFLNGAILGMSRQEVQRKFDEIVSFAEVEKFVDTPVKRYSSGMYVRLAFAVAAFLEPEILLVDEVLAVGDLSFQRKCLGKLDDVSKQGRTVLFVSHNMAAITRLCSRGILLDKGSILIDNNVNSTVEKYINQNNSSFNRTVIFSPKQDLPIFFREVNVSAINKNMGEVFDITDILKFKIKYQIKERIRGVNLSFALKRDGITIFRSWDTDSDAKLFDLRQPGKYSTQFEIPNNLLTPGIYTVYLAIGRPGVGPIIQYDDCMNIEIENLTIDGTHSSFTRGGFIIVPLDWKTTNE